MAARGNPNIASIPPGAPFLPTLVDALLKGYLIDGFKPGDDPLALANATIWVPTRRAARELATEFVTRLDNAVALLPDIRALGDVDDDLLFFDEPSTSGPVRLEESVGSLERQLALAKLIARWATSLEDRQRELYDNAEILVPATFADATWFAQDLARLMDMVATEEADWSKLNDLVEADFSEWWQLTLKFLEIATKTWPLYLAETGKIEGATIRAQHLRRQATIYRENGSKGPVIAAGSTGSIPATGELLKTIATMPNGVVVLPGLDRDISDDVWETIDLPDNDRDDSGTAPGHPQYGLRKLLREMGNVLRGDVHHIGGIEDTSRGPARVREQLVSAALLPSAATGQWQRVFENFDDASRASALSSIALIEAPGEREEALAIAFALREKLVDPKATAALVTPDRNLARRVAVELRRFGLDVDDSAGQPLRNKPHGTFARLVLNIAYKGCDPIALASLIKHPLACFGADRSRTLRSARLLELTTMRGAIEPIVLGDFADSVENARLESLDEHSHTHPSVKLLSDEDWADVLWLGETLDWVFASANEGKTSSLSTLAIRTVKLIEACGVGDDENLKTLYEGEDGKSLSGFLSDLVEQCDDTPADHEEWPDIFDALLGSRVVRSTGGTHPRLSILGPLEARLQTFDRVVLGGLNERTWPAAARNDPFLSRPMKSELGLPPPERRTGLAAHDFQMMLGMGDVVLTRSARADNAPTVASRWVQRLLMVAGEITVADMRKRGENFLAWVAQIDQPRGDVRSVEQPKPKPPLAARPTKLSITEIETWIKDPYAIYAKHILKFVPLAPLIREADAREKGQLYHQILEDFVRGHVRETGEMALASLARLADQHFEASAVPSDIAATWRPRFDAIAKAFVDWHEAYIADVLSSAVELSARREVGHTGFELTGRADRIDRLKDGTLSIIDYKTGTMPSKKSVMDLSSPQLPLTAALAERSAFKKLDAAPSSKVMYVGLKPEPVLKPVEVEADGLGDAAWKQLTDLIVAYQEPEKPYASKARIPKDTEREGDYDHLARVREWSLAEDGGDP